jgi:hypothetical protein
VRFWSAPIERSGDGALAVTLECADLSALSGRDLAREIEPKAPVNLLEVGATRGAGAGRSALSHGPSPAASGMSRLVKSGDKSPHSKCFAQPKAFGVIVGSWKRRTTKRFVQTAKHGAFAQSRYGRKCRRGSSNRFSAVQKRSFQEISYRIRERGYARKGNRHEFDGKHIKSENRGSIRVFGRCFLKKEYAGRGIGDAFGPKNIVGGRFDTILTTRACFGGIGFALSQI